MMKRSLLILICAVVLLCGCSLPLMAETADTTAPSDWTIPEYDEKSYTAMKAAMDVYDPLAPEAPGLLATAAVLMDAQTGQILYEIDPDGLRYPASLTKMMTLVVVLNAVEEGTVTLEDKVVFSETAVTQESSFLKLDPGTTVTLDHCLKVMMVFSANDAAFALAEHVGGTVENFASMMNETAKALGMNASNFVNPNGLPDPNHWTTARDLAILSRHCVLREDVMRYASLEYVEINGGKKIYNTNKLLFWTDGADGLKTGKTIAAGHCLAATAERNGMRLISVTLGSPGDYDHYIDGMKLLEYGFANYSLEKVVTKGDIFGKVPVLYGRENEVEVAAAEDLFCITKNGETAKAEIVSEFAEAVEGPADAGLDGGDVVVTYNGTEVGRCDLLTTEEIRKRTVFQWLGDFFKALLQSI
ncbi:MAG: D-alanyl-D-alanine carboxypeptidase [Firmicutes bacterium]|nr:D-alanyl-D-alanine carboxypeptidase [Bacillota bacterium]